jgi:hypothetical protein
MNKTITMMAIITAFGLNQSNATGEFVGEKTDVASRAAAPGGVISIEKTEELLKVLIPASDKLTDDQKDNASYLVGNVHSLRAVLETPSPYSIMSDCQAFNNHEVMLWKLFTALEIDTKPYSSLVGVGSPTLSLPSKFLLTGYHKKFCTDLLAYLTA